MAQKCVHQGCGKTYTGADDEVCRYHPGPPIFHEGQKGWSCCKPRTLTFEEFMSIEPCTEGKHSTTDHPPKIEKKTQALDDEAASTPRRTPISAASSQPQSATAAAPSRTASQQQKAAQPAPPPESDDDDPSLEIPDGRVCRRRGCGAAYQKSAGPRGADEACVHHPGAPLFHEGSKGYTCCKRRVLEFDQFMKIEGCVTKPRHLFVGSGKKGADGKADGEGGGGEELLETVRHDFYQTATSVIASYFLKKIDKDAARVGFRTQAVDLDLLTTDSPTRKRYRAEVPLFAPIDPERSAFKILGTKLELTLAKADGSAWPVLRSDDRLTGEILQIGRAGRA